MTFETTLQASVPMFKCGGCTSVSVQLGKDKPHLVFHTDEDMKLVINYKIERTKEKGEVG